MARRVIYMAVLNIKTHPHSPEKYEKIIKAAERSRPVKLRGDSAAMIGYLLPQQHNLRFEDMIT